MLKRINLFLCVIMMMIVWQDTGRAKIGDSRWKVSDIKGKANKLDRVRWVAIDKKTILPPGSIVRIKPRTRFIIKRMPAGTTLIIETSDYAKYILITPRAIEELDSIIMPVTLAVTMGGKKTRNLDINIYRDIAYQLGEIIKENPDDCETAKIFAQLCLKASLAERYNPLPKLLPFEMAGDLFEHQDIPWMEIAFSTLEHCKEQNPGDPQFSISIGNIYTSFDQYDKALAEYEQALKIAPRNSLLFFSIAFTYEKMDVYEKSIDNIIKAIELEPEDERFYPLLKLLLRRIEALSYYESLMNVLDAGKKSDQAEIRYRAYLSSGVLNEKIGKYYELNKEPEKAGQYCEKARKDYKKARGFTGSDSSKMREIRKNLNNLQCD